MGVICSTIEAQSRYCAKIIPLRHVKPITKCDKQVGETIWYGGSQRARRKVVSSFTIYEDSPDGTVFSSCLKTATTLSGVCRDPKDDMVFECAVKADAEIILSGDNDLLSMKTYRGIEVLTARQYRFTPPPA